MMHVLYGASGRQPTTMLFYLFLGALVQSLYGSTATSNSSVFRSWLTGDDTPCRQSLATRGHVEFGTRDEADIIITCLATILACTWTAFHPNIPAPNDSWFDGIKRRVRMMIYALLAPEAVTTFAMRQWLAARELKERYNNWADQHTSSAKSSLDPVGCSKEDVALFARRSQTEESNPERMEVPVQANECTEETDAQSTHSRESNIISPSANLPIPPAGTSPVSITKPPDPPITNGIGYTAVLTHISKLFHRPVLREREDGEVERWTMAHGFFLQMGGFMASKKGMPLFTIRATSGRRREMEYMVSGISTPYNSIEGLIDDGKILAPTITRDDIEDRSKGDAISKTVVVVQTSWFFAQCIARWSAGFTVTELEVITLGFVVLNGLTYMFWWHKPQNVGVPVYLEWIDTNNTPDPPSTMEKSGWFTRRLHALAMSTTLIDTAEHLISLCFTPFLPIASLIIGSDFSDAQPLRVSMFHSDDSRRSRGKTVSFSMSVVAIVFGAVHLAPAWVLDFPTPAYGISWKVCSIITTTLPITVVPFFELYKRTRNGNQVLNILLIIQVMALSFAYIAARITLFVVALVSLGHLSPDALATIEWLSIFPHL